VLFLAAPALEAQPVSTREITDVYRTILAGRECSGRGHAGSRGSASRVALDLSSGEALVYCTYNRNSLAGAGFLVHLRHTDGVWAVIKWHVMWVS